MIGIDQAARDAAAVWLPPGIAAADNLAPGDADNAEAADADLGNEAEGLDRDFAEVDAASSDLPAFLTET